MEESEAKLERNRKVDERLGRLEENLKVLTAITQENRSSLSNSVADRKEYTEEYRTDREEITKLITTLSSNVTALQAQAVSYAKSNPTDQLEPNSEEPQRIADRFAKISEEITEYSSTLQTLRSEHDFFTAQHERESIRRKAERARISDEIAMHADVLSRFRDVTTREAASKAKNILSLSTTIHEVVPRVRAMEVHLREEAAGRTVGRPPWTPAPRIHFPLKLPSTTIQDTTAGSSSNGSNSASSAVVDGLPESSVGSVLSSHRSLRLTLLDSVRRLLFTTTPLKTSSVLHILNNHEAAHPSVFVCQSISHSVSIHSITDYPLSLIQQSIRTSFDRKIRDCNFPSALLRTASTTFARSHRR